MRGDTDDSDMAYCRRPFGLRQERMDKERNPIRNDIAKTSSEERWIASAIGHPFLFFGLPKIWDN